MKKSQLITSNNLTHEFLGKWLKLNLQEHQMQIVEEKNLQEHQLQMVEEKNLQKHQMQMNEEKKNQENNDKMKEIEKNLHIDIVLFNE